MEKEKVQVDLDGSINSNIPQNCTLNIIDADTVLFLIAYNLKDTGSKDDCVEMTHTFVTSILQRTNSHYYLGFLGGDGNFRKGLSSDYKAKRAERPEYMLQWEPVVREILIKDWNFIVVDGIEAEDALVISYNYYKKDYRTIVSHVDKDLNFIPGEHYNYQKHTSWNTTEFGGIELSGSKTKKLKGTGLMWFYSQLLCGDWGTDGVRGLKGYGPVKIYNLLKDCKTEKQLLRRVYSAYLRESTKDAFILVWQLIRMLDYPLVGLDMWKPIKYNRFNIEDL